MSTAPVRSDSTPTPDFSPQVEPNPRPPEAEQHIARVPASFTVTVRVRRYDPERDESPHW